MRKVLPVIATLLLLSSCSSSPRSTIPTSPEAQPGSAQSPATQDETGLWPAPAELGRTATEAPLNSSGRLQLGAADTLELEMNTSVPWFYRPDSPTEMHYRSFSPESSPGFPSEIPVAFKGYTFPLAGYDGPLDFVFRWSDYGPVAGTLYLGVANVELNAWEWFEPDEKDSFSLPTREPYLNAESELYVVVMILDYDAILEWIRIGGNAPPFAGMRIDGPIAPQGPVTLDNYWDCFDADGEVSSIACDLDGDGSFETDIGTEMYAFTSVTAPGEHALGVKVTDNEGLSTTAYRSITINDWQAEVVDTGGGGITVLNDAGQLHISYYNILGEQSYAYGSTGAWQIEPLEYDESYGHIAGMFLDPSDSPVIVAISFDGSRILAYDGTSWLEAYPPLTADLPDYGKVYLVYDTAGLPHIAAGTNKGLDPGPPWIPDPQLIYWYYNGAEWVERLNRAIGSNFHGFNLAAGDMPQLSYTPEDYPNEWNHIYSWWDQETETWHEQAISEVNHRLADFLTANGINYLLEWGEGTLYLDEGAGWYQAAGADHPAIGGKRHAVTVDPQGVVHTAATPTDFESFLYQASYSKLVYATYENGAWRLETVLDSELGTLDSVSLGVDGAGVVHIICSARAYRDMRAPFQTGESPPAPRVMHFWR